MLRGEFKAIDNLKQAASNIRTGVAIEEMRKADEDHALLIIMVLVVSW